VNCATLSQLNLSLSRWEALLSSPIWYLTIIPEIEAFNSTMRNQTPEVKSACKALLYDFFERHLAEGAIALGHDSWNADVERQPIDTVVIHHTSNAPGLRLARLSAIELIRLYAPYFASPTAKKDQRLKGKPICSGHVREGEQVFWPYHWIVRGDGRVERLLSDSEIGWHAGNWNINCRSIAIVLDNDYDLGTPSARELQGVANIIRDHYGNVSLSRILGHREVNAKTTCPSELFLGRLNRAGWKSNLIDRITV
jgi:N-acetylmuramoyl-L-alanine amidase